MDRPGGSPSTSHLTMHWGSMVFTMRFLPGWKLKRLTSSPLSVKDTKRVFGRADGPAFVHRCAINDKTAGARKTTSVSRAWRRTAKWLHAILKAKGIVNSSFARKKVFHYSHPPRLPPVMPPRSRWLVLRPLKVGGG